MVVIVVIVTVVGEISIVGEVVWSIVDGSVNVVGNLIDVVVVLVAVVTVVGVISMVAFVWSIVAGD